MTAAIGMATAVTAHVPPLDIDAFVEREARNVLHYFLRRVDVADDAADLLGETLLVVWRGRHRIPNDPVEARMWLFGVARKVLSTQRRGRVRRVALADRLRDDLAVRAGASAVAVGEDVRAAVRTLPVVDREIIGLVYWEGFSLQQAATILGMRPATVRSRHARARARLRDALLEQGYVDEA